MKYLKSHLATRFPNLLANSKNLTFLHIFPARQAEDCAHSVRNGRSEHTQLSHGLLASPERPKWDLLCLVTSGHSVWVVHTHPVTDWANDVKWSIPAALTSWYCEGPKGDRAHWDIFSKFISDLVEHEFFCLECYYLIWSLACCIINNHSSSVSRHRNVLYSLHLCTMRSSHKHCFFTIPDILFGMKNGSVWPGFGFLQVFVKCLGPRRKGDKKGQRDWKWGRTISNCLFY